MDRLYFLTEERIGAAEYCYRSHNFDESADAEAFFRRYGPGYYLDGIKEPFERFHDYEILLRRLKSIDAKKYLRMHKGTPFYFLAWTAFDLGNYEKALFYADAAMAEDIKNAPDTWRTLPAASLFLKLGVQESEIMEEVARRVILKIRDALGKQFDRFNDLPYHGADITLDAFARGFVNQILGSDDPSMRTIVSTLYCYLLEFVDLQDLIALKSDKGGSIQPFILHLFKGGLIFESLIKQVYPGLMVTKRNGKVVPATVLGDYLTNQEFQRDFGITNVKTSGTLAEAVETARGSGIKAAFETTAKLRNTTGHNLIWPDVFNDEKNYNALFEQEVNALFHIIKTKFLSNSLSRPAQSDTLLGEKTTSVEKATSGVALTTTTYTGQEGFGW